MPGRELERLQTVNRFLKLRINVSAEMQEIAGQIAAICNAPIITIDFMDERIGHINFLNRSDLSWVEGTGDFCKRHMQDSFLIIPDTTQDERFADSPFVTGAPYIRFYAGIPLVGSDEHFIGTICAYDIQPKELDDLQQEILKILAKQVTHLLEFDESIQLLKEEFIASRKREITLRSFFESTSACHLLIDRDMKILSFNKELNKLVIKTQGISLKEDEPVMMYVNKEFQEEFAASCTKAMAGSTVHLERFFEFPGSSVHFYLIFAPAFDKEGIVIGVSMNAIDITDRVKEEKRVKDQNRSLRKIQRIQLNQLHEPAANIIVSMQKIMEEQSDSEYLKLMEISVKELAEKISK